MNEDGNVEVMPPEPGFEPPASAPRATGMNANTWAMLTHLAGLLGLFFPVAGNICGPLVVWVIKKDEFPEVDRHGKEALNFQLSFALWTVLAAAIGIPLCFVLIGFVLLPAALLVIYVVLLILPILAGLKANEGGWYVYPMTIRFIK